MTSAFDRLERLFSTIEQRIGADPQTSYTATLFANGRASIARKLGEEAVETLVAAMADDREALVTESADLLYHLLVLWADAGLGPDDVMAELARREGISGLEEKAGRGGTDRTTEGGRCEMPYDRNNIFAKILRGEIPANTVYEDEHALAFHDINPQAPVHVLVIPKGEYVSMDDFAAQAPPGQIAGFFRAIGKVARELGLAEGGYRILANHGADAHQEVPHFHVHIFGGRPLGPMLAKGGG